MEWQIIVKLMMVFRLVIRKTDCKQEHCAERIVNKGLEKSSSRVTLEKRERLKSTMSSFFTI